MPTISIIPEQVRFDSTILPIITSDLSVTNGFVQIDNWQYLPFVSPKTFIPLNRTKKNIPLVLKNCEFPDLDTPLETGISASASSIERISGEGYSGAITDDALDADFCSVQVKITSTALTTGISLQDESETISHIYFDVATVAHAILLGQEGFGKIIELGEAVANNASFKYEVGDTVMIEHKGGIANGIVRYYLIKPDGMMKLLRTTRTKLTENPKAEFLLYFTGSQLDDVNVFSNDFVETTFESIGVAYFRNDTKQLYWQMFDNQKSSQSIGESLELADKRTKTTYSNSKRRLASWGLTPKAQSIDEYWKYQDFVDYHDTAREFIFIDYARKKDGVPTEYWVKFTSAFVDATRNGCQFNQSQSIVEDFRTDYIPRLDDTIPPEVEITEITEGSAILTGTASDNVLLVSLQLFLNGFKYGDAFLPDENGDWELTVPTEDLIGGENSFYVIATDYAGNTTQSNTEILEIAEPDTEAPTVPTGLALNVISSTQINVSWDASTDNNAVTGYDLQRATNAGFSTGLTNIPLGNVTSYNNTGLTPSTQYYYRVRAHDAVPNNSAYSSSQNATTDANTPITIIASDIVGSSDGSNVTSSSLNSTGATALIAIVSFYSGGGSPTLADSKGNTWTALTLRNGGTPNGRIYYCLSPTVGTGHTFTVTGSGTILPVLAVFAFSNVGSFDQENGATGFALTLQTGSITPPTDNAVLVTFLSSQTNGADSVDSGFTLLGAIGNNANHISLGVAYKIQTTATAVNPEWATNLGFGQAVAVGIASFEHS